MENPSEIDLNFLVKLSSLYESLTHSAVDPVVINYTNNFRNLKISSKMFYDAYGNAKIKDLEIAEGIMRKRIFSARNDIRQHHNYHSEFLRLFYDIDENINTNNRIKVAKIAREISDKTKEYICKIVDNHIRRLEKNAFLSYSSCNKEYSFFIPNANMIANLVFNPKETHFGAEKELNEIIYHSKDFSISNKRIPVNKIATQNDLGEGIIDTLLRGKHELNIELLRRMEFVLD